MNQSELVNYLIEGDWQTSDNETSLKNFKSAFNALESGASIHDFAYGYNFDNGVEELLLVLNHPKIDKATVLAMFWMLGPGYFQQYETADEIPEFEVNHFNSVLKVHAFLQTVKKRDQTLSFDPKNDDQLDWTTEYFDQMQRLPNLGKQPFYKIPIDFFDKA